MKNESTRTMRAAIRHSGFAIRHSLAKRALTMVELLIVIIIIGVLISSILVAATSLVGKSKERNTASVLQLVSDAVEEFKREQTARATLTKNPAYKKRYGLYPPDELEVFSLGGVPVPAGAAETGSLATPRGSLIVPAPEYQAMRFYTDRTDLDADAKEHRDLAALIVAIESYGDASRALLDKIPDRNRSAGVLDDDKKPAQYLDRPEDLNGTRGVGDGFKSDDLQIRYILDDWGIPISYLAQRDHPTEQEKKQGKEEIPSKNHAGWNEGSTELIRLNGGQPIIFSYGANGEDQLTKEMMEPNGNASLVGDFEPEPVSPENKDHVIDHPANADNVYANPALKEKLAKGIAE